MSTTSINSTDSLATIFSPGTAVPGAFVDAIDDSIDPATAAVVQANGTILIGATADLGGVNLGEYTGGNHLLSYDHDGNTTTDAKGNTYTYDAWNHLTGVKDATGTSIASYTVNALGQRITQAYPTTVSNLYYNSQGQIIEVQNSSGTTTQQTVYSPFYVNDVVERDDNSTSGSYGKTSSGLGTRYWAEHDTNHDQVAILISSSSVQARWVYDAYGTPTLTAGTAPSVFWAAGFQGGWTDSVTGLVHFNHRDLNTVTGTWMTADPAGYIDGASMYVFVHDQPSIFTDQEGLAANWHHLLPQGVFDDAFFARHANLRGVINIDDAKWGWVIDSSYHTGMGGIHSRGWNDDWQTWVRLKEEGGGPITEECVKAQLKRMMGSDEYAPLLKRGAETEYSYKGWKSMSGVDKELELADAEKLATSGTAASRWNSSSLVTATVFGAIASLDAFGTTGSHANSWYRTALQALIDKNAGRNISFELRQNLSSGNLFQNASAEILNAGASMGGIEGSAAGITLQIKFQDFANEVGDALR